MTTIRNLPMKRKVCQSFSLVAVLLLGVCCCFATWNTLDLLKATYNGDDSEDLSLSPQLDVGLQPLDCKNLLHSLHRDDEEPAVTDPNDGPIYTRVTKLDPPFYVSLHNKDYDGPRFDIFKLGYYYEKELTAAFQKVLKDNETMNHPNARVLDVGGNVGWFTHLSASLGYHVDVFEPNIVNGIRICQSIRFNEWSSSVSERSLVHKRPNQGSSSVNFYNNGVGETASTLDLYVSDTHNPGTGSFVKRGDAKNATTTVQVIPLDQFAQDKGWFETRPLIPVLKVDVEGFESQVFRGAARLIKSGMIRNIFMEAAQSDDAQELATMYTSIMEAGYYLHATGAWMGPNNEFEKPEASTKETVDYVVKEVIPSISGSVNIWWKRKQ